MTATASSAITLPSATLAAAANPNSASETANRIKRLLKEDAVGEGADAARLDELRRIFGRLIAMDELRLCEHHHKEENNEIKCKWNTWLKKNHETFLHQLADRIRCGRKSALRTFCGVIASSPATPVTSPNIRKEDAKIINERLLHKMMHALVYPKDDVEEKVGVMEEGMLHLLEIEFLGPYRDAQYFTLLAVKHLASQLYSSTLNKNTQKNQCSENEIRETKDVGLVAENLLRILMKVEIATSSEQLDAKEDKNGSRNFLISPPANWFSLDEATCDSDKNDNDDDSNDDSGERVESESSDDEVSNADDNKKKRKRTNLISSSERRLKQDSFSSTRPSWQSFSKHRKAFQDSWLAVLKLPHLPSRALKHALQHIPIMVLPIVSAPLRFADFCTRSFQVGGVASLLALHSLYILMTQHGLEYPNFYASLYKLVEPKIFYAKHRTRFFKLLTMCLWASDMLPAYVVAAFCKRLCRCALSVPPSGSLFVLALVSNLLRKHGECACLIHRGGGPMTDVFDAQANDPARCRALGTTLWELEALERHYHPAVSALAKECGKEDEKTLMHDMDVFLLHTYKSLFDKERKKGDQKKKEVVPLAFTEPKSLFRESDIFHEVLSLPRTVS